MRILLAEDERDLNNIITKKLTADGYSVDACFDGEEALDCLSAADYDAVILDAVSYTHLDVYKRQTTGTTGTQNLTYIDQYLLFCLNGSAAVDYRLICGKYRLFNLILGIKMLLRRCV